MSLSSLSSPIRARDAASLQRRFILYAGIGGTMVVGLLFFAAGALLNRDILQQGDARIGDAARRAQIVVNEALAERVREARALALSPEVIGAATAGAARAGQLGLQKSSIPDAEKQFAAEHTLDVARDTRSYLRALLPQLDIAEMLLTEAHGYNAVITERSSDFVQSDEAWWQNAWRDGIGSADAAYDESAHQTTVSIASVIQSGGNRLGVLKLAFSVAPLVRSLAVAGGGVRIDVLDSANHILIGSDSAMAGKSLAGMPGGESEIPSTVAETADSQGQRAVALKANSGRWRVVAHMPVAELDDPFEVTRRLLGAGALALLIILAALLYAMSRFLQRRITAPATELAEVAEAVAGGDFSIDPRRSMADDEIGRLSRAVSAMIIELRRLAGAIGHASGDTQGMAREIMATSDALAASAGEIANTASDLSAQSTSMAENIAALAILSGGLRDVAAELSAGAHDGVARVGSLRQLAFENRKGLDESAASLAMLSADVDESQAAITELGHASEEIKAFVALVRQLARQSKLLALNAAMEAARAGDQGKGFAVVAGEVRRLATMSSDAAEHTGVVVGRILKGIERTHGSTGKVVEATTRARDTTVRASASFGQIEQAMEESSTWTSSVDEASTRTKDLVLEMNQRLDELSGGTENFAAAMEEVAASSEQQSASTQEIAATATALANAAEQLAGISARLKIV